MMLRIDALIAKLTTLSGRDEYVHRITHMLDGEPEEYEAIRAAYEKAGMAGLHQQDLTSVLQRWNGWHASMVDIAGFHTGLGHPAEALDWLERACDVRSGRLVWLNSGMPGSRMAQYFDSLRSEPRFIRILERVQLPS